MNSQCVVRLAVGLGWAGRCRLFGAAGGLRGPLVLPNSVCGFGADKPKPFSISPAVGTPLPHNTRRCDNTTAKPHPHTTAGAAAAVTDTPAHDLAAGETASSPQTTESGVGSSPTEGLATGKAGGEAKSTTRWLRLVEVDGKVGSLAKVVFDLDEGTDVYDLKEAAKSKFASKLGGFDAADLVVREGKEGEALSEDVDVGTLQQGKTRGDPLLIYAPKPMTLTVYTRTGKGRKVIHNSTITFATNEDFKGFVATRDIWHMKRTEGRADERLSAITSLAGAVSASQQDGTFLLLDNPADEFREDVSALKGGEKNRATGLEQQTTKALVSDVTFQRDYGNLSVVNGGEPVEFKVAGESNIDFELDGLVRNGRQLLLNSAKWTPTEGDVTEVCDTASRLRQVLESPSDYETEPEWALGELEGLLEVIPVLSGYCFADGVKKKAESRGVRWVHTDGKGFAVEARESKQSA